MNKTWCEAVKIEVADRLRNTVEVAICCGVRRVEVPFESVEFPRPSGSDTLRICLKTALKIEDEGLDFGKLAELEVSAVALRSSYSSHATYRQAIAHSAKDSVETPGAFLTIYSMTFKIELTIHIHTKQSSTPHGL